MQPSAHTSTLFVYRAGLEIFSTVISSGARYPLVPLAFRVVTALLDVPGEEIPKSTIFHTLLLREYRTAVSLRARKETYYCTVSSLDARIFVDG